MNDVSRPVALADRALGPDLARGAMLAFIALANAHFFLTAPSVRGGYPQDGSAVDSAVIWLLSTVVDGRSFPMFGVLFGYGVAQIARRQEGASSRAVGRLLRRRALVLLGVGFVHAVLLFAGDILTAYGVLLLVGAGLVRWSDRALLITAGLGLLPLFALNLVAPITAEIPPDAAMLPPDLAAMFTERPVYSVVIGLLGPVMFGAPFAVGVWAGRRRLLERPGEHRPLLRAAAVTGLAVAVLGAQPTALALAGVVDVPQGLAAGLLGALHAITGILGGIGYAALFGLIALRLLARDAATAGRGDAVGRLVAAVAATGQRSMTCYLAQSVVWTVVFTPFLLDLSGTLTVATAALLSLATWAATVVLADRLHRSGRRGPFEVLVRRLTYGQSDSRSRSQAPSSPSA